MHASLSTMRELQGVPHSTLAGAGLSCNAMICRYLGLAGNDVQVPAIAPFPEDPSTAVIAVSVGGPGVQMTAGYSILRTAGLGIPIEGLNHSLCSWYVRHNTRHLETALIHYSGIPCYSRSNRWLAKVAHKDHKSLGLCVKFVQLHCPLFPLLELQCLDCDDGTACNSLDGLSLYLLHSKNFNCGL